MWAPPHAHEHYDGEQAWYEGLFGEHGAFVGHEPASAPFDILGVRHDASADELRSAYRRRLMETHPDKGGDPEECRKVIAAWDALVRVGRV